MQRVGIVIGHNGRQVGECVGQVFGLGTAPVLAHKSNASRDGKDCEEGEDEEQDAERDEEQDAERHGGALVQRNCSSSMLV